MRHGHPDVTSIVPLAQRSSERTVSNSYCVIERMDTWAALLTTLFATSGSAIALGIYVAVTGRTPRVHWLATQAQTGTRVRAQGFGLILIGGVLLLSAFAVELGSHSSERAYWVLVVWVALIGGLIGVRYMVGGSRRPTGNP
jgi:drug/metabolite transporter (DMT)-like permease